MYEKKRRHMFCKWKNILDLCKNRLSLKIIKCFQEDKLFNKSFKKWTILAFFKIIFDYERTVLKMAEKYIMQVENMWKW